MRYVRIVTCVFIMTVLVLGSAGFTSVLATVSPGSPRGEHRASSYVLRSHSNYFSGIQAASYVQEEAFYIAAIHYPITGSPAVDARIKAYVDTCVQLASAQSTMYSPEAPIWKLTLYSDYEVFSYSEDIVSFKFDKSIYGTGIETKRQIETMTFNLRTGAEYKASELFVAESQGYESFVFTPTHLISYSLSEDGRELRQVETSLLELMGIVKFSLLNGGGIASKSPSNAPKIALTFDDGPHPEYTAKILNELKQRNAVATFYVLGNRVESQARLMRRIISEGSEIGNHSWDHPNLTALSPAGVMEQLARTNAVIHSVTGTSPKTMRPPFGFHNSNVVSATDMPIILWSIDTEDWKNRDADAIVEHIAGKAKNGDIVLMHDIYPSTAEAVGLLLDRLQAKGFEFVTVSELLSLNDYPHIALSGRVFHKK